MSFLARISLFVLIFNGVSLLTAETLRERLSFNEDWMFKKGDPRDAAGAFEYERVKPWVLPTGDDLLPNPPARMPVPKENPGAFHNGDISYLREDLDVSDWRRLDLPHDWGVEGPFDIDLDGDTAKLPWFGVAWYRKEFSLPEADAGKKIYLDVDGAMSYAMVWINGRFAGGWPYGYTSWRVDLSEHIKLGEKNVIMIRLDNPRDSSRWYPGGGIYRNVWLVKTAPIHVAQWGVDVKTPLVSEKKSIVEVGVRVKNTFDKKHSVDVETKLYRADGEGRIIGETLAVGKAARLAVDAEGEGYYSHSIAVEDAKLWSPEEPALYVAETLLYKDKVLVDRVETVFGIREVRMIAGEGMFLNGKPVTIKGVCMHHDLGALGAAFNFRAAQRQLEILKEMGCNGIRTAHNPPAPELLDLCDRMGFLVMVETFDCWALGKKRDDYSRVFADWHEKDLRAIVRRDLNHPSVIMWNIGNEVREQARSDGWRLGEHLAGILRSEDRTRAITMGFNSIRSPYFGYQRLVDVAGFNYKPFEYAKLHATHPWMVILGAETASTVSSRGEYFFPVSEDKSKGLSDFQVSSYDLYAPRWAGTPDEEFRGQDGTPGVIGEYVWTGFDYLGEPTPYNADSTNLLNFSKEQEREQAAQELRALGKIKIPSRSSYFGIFDLAGFPKDRYFLYKSRWLPEQKTAHILPHWNWPERIGEITPVHVYTSGDEAELFLNGKSLGRKKLAKGEYRFRWNEVLYQPGELKVKVWKHGKPWTEATRKTTGEVAQLKLEADRQKIRADGQDLAFVKISLLDKSGELVPRSKNLIQFEVTGPAEIAAVDNGDATSLTSFQASEIKAYNGLALVILKAKKGRPGEFTLKAKSEGLEPVSLQMSSSLEE